MWKDYNEIYELNVKMSADNRLLSSKYRCACKQVVIVDIENDRLKKSVSDKWTNPYNWILYTGTFKTINKGSMKADVPANCYITPFDRLLRKTALKLRCTNISDTAKSIEKWIFGYLRYIHDDINDWHPDYIEYFQMASLTYRIRKADCDDYAILFQTLMHILGHGDRCIVCCGKITGIDGLEYGHAYNRVYINNEWKVFDSQSGAQNKLKVTYPNLLDSWFWFNYWNVYGGIKNDEI